MKADLLPNLFVLFQVYLCTKSGIQDKRFIHFTQFIGLFIRPENFTEDLTEKIIEEPVEEIDHHAIMLNGIRAESLNFILQI